MVNTVLTGLTGGQSYDVRVAGANSSGTGPFSSAVTFLTPALPAVGTVKYRGLDNSEGDQTDYAGLAVDFPAANAVTIPVFFSTSSQTSTDVAIGTDTAALGGWISAAVAAGFQTFVAIYLNPADGTARGTITPGNSFAGVATFMAGLQAACVTIAQIASSRGATGMWCGVGLQPWAGAAAGDTGPFSAVHMAQWQSIYNAVKAVWPTGVISYSGAAATIGLADPTGPWTVKWSFWDSVSFEVFPATDNSLTTAAGFEAYETTQADADPTVAAATGNMPIWAALKAYSQAIGRKITIRAMGIIPAQGNQAFPSGGAVRIPPGDYTLQAEWWQAQMDLLVANADYFDGFFPFSSAFSLFPSTFTGPSQFGIRGTPSAAIINSAYATLGTGGGTGGTPGGSGGGGSGSGTLVVPPIAGAVPGTWQSGTFNGLPYKFLLPHNYDPTNHTYKFLLFLHQLDNASQIPGQIDPWFNTAAFRRDYPCIVVAPQLDQSADPSGNTINWGGVDGNQQPSQLAYVALTQSFAANYAVEPGKIYITGNSMGGIGSWDTMIKYNSATGTKGHVFKAAVILAGATYSNGYPTPASSVITALKNVPIWAIHGAQDDQVPLAWDQNMYAAEQASGGVMLYSEIAGAGHDVWDDYIPGWHGYLDTSIWTWLFAQ